MALNWQAIFDGVAGNFVWFIVGLGVGGLWRLLRSRFAGRAILGWHFRPPFTVVIGSPFGIQPGTTTLSPAAGLPIFGFGPLNALHLVWNILNDAFGDGGTRGPLVTSRTFDAQCYSNSLISIGYPLGNPVTSTLLDSLPNLPVRFDGHKVRHAGNGSVLYEPTYVSGSVTSDYGILVKAPNPLNTKAGLMILAGTETFGVKAAAELLSYERIRSLYGIPEWLPRWVAILASLLPSYRSQGRIVIVSCAVEGLYVSPPKVEATMTF